MIVEISLGSNTNASQNMAVAKALLVKLLPQITFSEERWTEPYPTPSVPHPTRKYLNCMARATTNLTQERLVRELKQIEKELGDSHDNHQQGIVLIDLDLLTYDCHTIKESVLRMFFSFVFLLTALVPVSGQQNTDTELLGKALDYFVSQKYHEAGMILEKLDRQYKLNDRFRAYLGLCYYYEWDYKKAAEQFDEVTYKLTMLSPHEQSVYLYAAGESYFQMGKYAEALDYFERDVPLCYDNEWGEVFYRIGLCQMKLEHWKEAVEAYNAAERFLSPRGNDDTARARLAQLQNMRMGCIEKINAAYKETCAKAKFLGNTPLFQQILQQFLRLSACRHPQTSRATNP